MDSTDWNKAHPIGAKVVLTLANGKLRVTRTASEAATWGGMGHIKVEAIRQGFVPLSWCHPFLPDTFRQSCALVVGGISTKPSS